MQRVLLGLLVLFLVASGIGLYFVLQPGDVQPVQAAPTPTTEAVAPAPEVPETELAEVAAQEQPAPQVPAEPVQEDVPVTPVEVEPQAGRTVALEFARIRGTVQLPEGTPLEEQLAVRILAAAPRRSGGSLALLDAPDEDDLLGEATLDDSGAFELSVPLDKQTVWIELDAKYLFLDEALSVQLEPQTSVVLRPRLGAWISGRLLVPDDASEEELEDVGDSVNLRADRLRSTGAMGISRNRHRRRTAEAGDGLAFEFTGVSVGPSYNLSTTPERLTAVKSEAFQPEAGEHVILDLAMTRGARMSGLVLDAAGNPVAEAELELMQDPQMFGQAGFDVREGETDDDGGFDLLGIRPGTTTVTISAEGFIETTEKVELAEGQHLAQQSFTLEAGNQVSGQVLWPDRTPVVDVEVNLRFDLAFLGGMEAFNAMKGAEGEARTDEQGRFTITGLGKGPFTVMSKAENEDDVPQGFTGVRPDWKARVDKVRPGAEVELILAPPIAISGHVVNDLGEPITEFRVSARTETGGMLGGLGAETTADSFEDDEGAFALDDLREGKWLVDATAEGYGRLDPISITVPQDEGADLLLVLQRAASVSGTVLDPTGMPVPWASVGLKFSLADIGRLASQSGGPPKATCDEEGQFVLEGLTPGMLSLIAQSEDFAESEEMPVEVAPAEAVDGVVLSLRIGGRILGEVLDDEGKPSAGRTIIAQVPTDPGNQRFANSDVKGEFMFESLAPGTYQVMAFGTGEDGAGDGGVDEENFADFFSDMKITMAEVVDGEDVHVVLGSKAGDPVTVNGRVVSAGKPVAGLLVSFFDDGGSMLEGMKFSNTKSDGSFTIKLGHPGRYLVNVQKVTGTGMQQNVEFARTVPEVEQHEMTLELPIAGISGTVYNPDRKPAANARISLSVDGPIRNGSFTGGNYAEIQTDDNGNYELLWLRPGQYSVAAGGPSMMAMFGGTDNSPGRQVRSGLKVKEGQRLSGIDFRLEEAGTLTGTVLDLAGQPVAEAAIFLRDGDGNSLDRFSFIATDAGGQFKYPGLSPGSYLVTARGEGLVSTVAASAQVRSGKDAEVLLTIDAGTVLVVTLSDKLGNPVECSIQVLDSEGHQVNGMWSMGELMAAFSAGGFSSLEQKVGPLPPGKYRVLATSTDGLSANKPVTLRSSMATRKLNLRLD